MTGRSSGAPTSPRSMLLPTPAPFPVSPISYPVSLCILVSSRSSFPRVAPLSSRLFWPVFGTTSVSPSLQRSRSMSSIVASVVPLSVFSFLSDTAGAICRPCLRATVCWTRAITLPHSGAISALCTFSRWFCHRDKWRELTVIELCECWVRTLLRIKQAERRIVLPISLSASSLIDTSTSGTKVRQRSEVQSMNSTFGSILQWFTMLIIAIYHNQPHEFTLLLRIFE